MAAPPLPAELLHASAVAVAGRAVVIAGPPGSGKSDLALRLVDRGALLLADDRVLVRQTATALLAGPPQHVDAALIGRLEVRGLGLVALPHAAEAPVALLVELDPAPPRLPAPRRRRLAGVEVAVLALDPRPAAAPVAVELALAQGLPA